VWLRSALLASEIAIALLLLAASGLLLRSFEKMLPSTSASARTMSSRLPTRCRKNHTQPNQRWMSSITN